MTHRLLSLLTVGLWVTLPGVACAWEVLQSVSSATAAAIAVNGDLIAGGEGFPGGDATSTVTRLRGGDGKTLWTASEPGRGIDAVVVDAADDVVAGGRGPNFGGALPGQFVVAKYDGATGAQAWRYEIVGGDSSDVSAKVLAIAADGDVLAAGEGVSSFERFTVVRLDGATGAEVWRFTLPNQGACRGGAADLVLDASGDVLVTGTTSQDGGFFAPCRQMTVKLDGDTGAELWRDVDLEPGVAIAVDGAGNAVAVGRCHAAKLDGATGAEQWRWETTTFCTDDHGHVVDVGVALPGSTGGVFVAKQAPPPSFPVQPAVIRLDGATGSEEWGWPLPLAAVPQFQPMWERDALAVTPAGDVLVGGLAGVVALDGGSGAATADYDLAFSGIALGADGSVGTAGTGVKGSAARFALARFWDRLAGTSLALEDRAGNPSARRLVWKAKDKLVLPPSTRYATDPTAVGATLTVENPTTGEIASIALPAAGWTTKITSKGTNYRYLDNGGALGPCKTVKITTAKGVDASCAGAGIGFSLDEPSQGSLQIRLQVGTDGARWCSHFGGFVTRDLPATGAQVGHFQAKKAPTAPDCPPA